MKSLEELLSYYEGVQMGCYATSELPWPPGKAQIEMRDGDRRLDSALLYDADRLTKASLVSFLAYSRLRSGGHETWGLISLYYARFHSISAMLRLVGRAIIGHRLLIRTDEKGREYSLTRKNTPEAREAGCGGGSHREQWLMFSRFFRDWANDEPPGQIASVLGEDCPFPESSAWYETDVEERNEANYLKSDAGVFFPETDFSGLQGKIVEEAKFLGNWDFLRTDLSPSGTDEPPGAWFYREMMAWVLIKYITTALVKLMGKTLLDQYLWLIHNLEAYDELLQHMRDDLTSGE